MNDKERIKALNEALSSIDDRYLAEAEPGKRRRLPLCRVAAVAAMLVLICAVAIPSALAGNIHTSIGSPEDRLAALTSGAPYRAGDSATDTWTVDGIIYQVAVTEGSTIYRCAKMSGTEKEHTGNTVTYLHLSDSSYGNITADVSKCPKQYRDHLITALNKSLNIRESQDLLGINQTFAVADTRSSGRWHIAAMVSCKYVPFTVSHETTMDAADVLSYAPTASYTYVLRKES